jgi:ABC-2 type transport system ATP-binding protein
MSNSALIFENVVRRFGSKVALDALNLEVRPGSIVGLIGRNGAGKTTALRLAHGLLHPDEGRISVLGLDPAKEWLEVRSRVSLLSEEASLYPWMRVREIQALASALHPRWDDGQADALVKRLELDPQARIKTLSRGTRAKVALMLSIACRPDLLLLDDPTAGLDPLVRREILEGILGAVSDEGGAVLYASHLVQDIERVADRVAVLDHGRLILEGSVEGIKNRTRRARAVFDADAPDNVEIAGKIDVAAEGRMLTVVAESANGELEASLRQLGAREVEVEPLPLEEILVALLRGRGAREDGDA